MTMRQFNDNEQPNQTMQFVNDTVKGFFVRW
jgi:hypothetical protein